VAPVTMGLLGSVDRSEARLTKQKSLVLLKHSQSHKGRFLNCNYPVFVFLSLMFVGNGLKPEIRMYPWWIPA
jgi:hypothetical protein